MPEIREASGTTAHPREAFRGVHRRSVAAAGEKSRRCGDPDGAVRTYAFVSVRSTL
jgi:hypothetical protein